MNTLIKKKEIIPTLMTIFIVFIMVGLSELMNNKEIVFPEITALAVGFIIAPKQVWRTNAVRTTILITLCAILGIIIVKYYPVPLWLQVSTAFLLCQIIFIFSGTGFAPMISAMVLPVLMGTETIIYPITAVILTITVLLCRHVLVKMKLRETYCFEKLPAPGGKDIKDTICRVLCGTIVIFMALTFEWKFVVAPPILVAFTEFATKESNARKKPISAVMTIFLCAFTGAVCRLFFVVGVGLSLTLTACIVTVFVILIMRIMGMYMPPAGALAILPMIIPETVLVYYPFQILLGASVFMLIARLWRDFFEKTNKDSCV